MYNLGLTPAQQVAYLETLRESHSMRVIVTVLTREEKHETSLSLPASMVLAGQVDVDAAADVTRSCSLTALDPNHTLAFDSAKIADGAVFADNMLSIEYGVWVPSIGKWIDAPVFRGPLSRFDRDGSEVTLEAQGKESLAITPHLSVNAYTVKKGTKRHAAIKDIMGRKGERSWRLQAPDQKLNRDISVVPSAEPWRAIVGGEGFGRGIAGAANEAFYDGEGYLVLRRQPKDALFPLSDGWLLSEPAVSFDMAAIRNWIRVMGSPPHGAVRSPVAVAQLTAADPLSAKSLGRNGKPRFLAEFVEDDHARSLREATQTAERLLSTRRKEAVNVSVEVLPIPTLEPLDVLRLDMGLEFSLTAFTIPLVESDSMSIGFTKRISVAGSRKQMKTKRRWVRTEPRKKKKDKGGKK